MVLNSTGKQAVRRLKNAVNCGRKGNNKKRRLKKKGNDNKIKSKFVKNGKDPVRVVGGTVTAENEIPWQVMNKHQINMSENRRQKLL